MKKVLVMLTLLLALCMTLSPLTAFAAFDDSYIEYTSKAYASTGIMDFSWMNEMPAGQRGFVKVVDGDFQFEDGTPVKFWGTTAGFSAAYMQKDASERTAEYLASLGCNMVRIHAIDCIWGGYSSGIVNFENYQNGMGTGPVGFHEKSLDQMDYLIYCLKEKGIYIHLDTSAGRRITIGEGFDEDEVTISKSYNLRGASFFDQRVSDIEYDYAKALMEHVNPYTGKAYCDEPAIAIVQRVNESSSLWVDWGGAGNLKNGFTNKLNARFNEWLLEKYGTREALAKAWTPVDFNLCGLGDDEDPTQGTVLSGTLGNWSEPSYIRLALGPSTKALNSSRHADWITFLCELQREDFQKFYDMLRDLGYGGAINCSNIMTGPVDLSNNYLGDVTEMNWYFSSSKSLTEHCVNADVNAACFIEHLLPYFSRASATDKAFGVTEWEVKANQDFRADGMITVAAYGSLQGWDFFLPWCLSDQNSIATIYKDDANALTVLKDPAYFGQMGLAAMIFRLGYIKPAENEVEYAFTAADIPANAGAPFNVVAPFVFTSRVSYNYIDSVYEGDADLVFTSGNTASGDFTKAENLVMQNNNPYSDGFQLENTLDAWLAKHLGDGAVAKTFGNQSFQVKDNVAYYSGFLKDLGVPDIQMTNDIMREFGLWGDDVGFIDGKAISDTKELVYDYLNGILSCVTDKACFITGVIPASEQVGSIKYTTSSDKATIALISTDNKKITESDSLYLYTCGRTRNADAELNQNGAIINYGNVGPILIQDVRGTFFFESEKDICNVWGLDANGKRVAQLDVTAKDGGYEFALGGYVNYEIRTTKDVPESSTSAPEESTSAPETSTSAPEASTSAPESSSSHSSQGGNDTGNGSPIIWIVIAAVAVIAVVVALVLSKKKKA